MSSTWRGPIPWPVTIDATQFQMPNHYLVVLAFALCLAGALVCVCLCGFYTMKIMRNFRSDREWGKLFAPSLLMGSFFNDAGNAARRKMWWALAGFLAFSFGLIGIAAGVAP